MQLELLQLYSSNIAEQDLINIKNMLADYFLEKAESEIENVSKDKKYSAETFKQWASEHNRAN